MKHSASQRRALVSNTHSTLSVTRQCRLLSVCRSSYYRQSKGETSFNLKLMRILDEHYLSYPFMGVASMTAWLRKDKGYLVNVKRVRRLYRLLNLKALVPQPGTSKPNKAHKVYPYLLRNLQIERPNQVWATDITCLPMARGFVYLMAIIDLHSRYVVGWSVSNTMHAEWCVETLEKAVQHHGPPEIINTDQGSQFTSKEFTDSVLSHGIRLSMDGKGRAIDNVFVERLWRSVKYECVYLQAFADGLEYYHGLKEYFEYYNHQRRHSSLDDQTPFSCYGSSVEKAA